MNYTPAKLATLFHKLLLVHVNIDDFFSKTHVAHYEPMMIRNISTWLLNDEVDKRQHTIEYQLFMMVQLYEFNELRQSSSNSESTYDVEPASETSLQKQHETAGLKIIVFLANSMMEELNHVRKAQNDQRIKVQLDSIVRGLGGMVVLIRTQIVICAWKIIVKTHPEMLDIHSDKAIPDVLRMANEVLCDGVLSEDVPGMIAEVGELLLNKLNTGEG